MEMLDSLWVSRNDLPSGSRILMLEVEMVMSTLALSCPEDLSCDYFKTQELKKKSATLTLEEADSVSIAHTRMRDIATWNIWLPRDARTSHVPRYWRVKMINEFGSVQNARQHGARYLGLVSNAVGVLLDLSWGEHDCGRAAQQGAAHQQQVVVGKRRKVSLLGGHDLRAHAQHE
jgi:hypothetical protein